MYYVFAPDVIQSSNFDIEGNPILESNNGEKIAERHDRTYIQLIDDGVCTILVNYYEDDPFWSCCV